MILFPQFNRRHGRGRGQRGRYCHALSRGRFLECGIFTFVGMAECLCASCFICLDSTHVLLCVKYVGSFPVDDCCLDEQMEQLHTQLKALRVSPSRVDLAQTQHTSCGFCSSRPLWTCLNLKSTLLDCSVMLHITGTVCSSVFEFVALQYFIIIHIVVSLKKKPKLAH